MNLRSQAIKGVIWSAIEKFGGQAVSFVVFFLLARLLEPEAFGLVALATVFLTFMQVFLEQGFTDAIIQRQEVEPEHLDTAFWISIGIGIVLTSISMAIAGVVANVFHQPDITPIIRCLSLGFILSSLIGVQQGIFRRRFAFKALTIRSLVARLSGGIVGVVMALSGFGVWSLVGQRLVYGMAEIMVLWWASDWRPGLRVSPRHFRELSSFGINIFATKLLSFFNQKSGDFLIGYFLGPVDLGYYTVAYRLLQLMTNMLTLTMTQVALPTFSRLQSDRKRLRSVFYTATQFASLISFPAFMSMAALAPELVQVFFGEQWLPSIRVMQILAFIGMLHTSEYFNGSVMLAVGKPSWRLGLNSLNAVTNVIAFLVVVQWGISAVATAYVIRGYLLSPLSIWMIRRLIHIKAIAYLSKYAPSLVASLVMVSTFFGVRHFLGNLIGVYGLLAVCVAIGPVVYATTIRLIWPDLFQKLVDTVRSIKQVKTEKS